MWLGEDGCDVAAFRAFVEQGTDPRDYPTADTVEHNVLVYDGDRLRDIAAMPDGRRTAQAELTRALSHGPGIVVFKGAFPDLAVVDRATDAFSALIEAERAAGVARGHQFAKPGANDRIWNAMEKLAVRAPEVFAD